MTGDGDAHYPSGGLGGPVKSVSDGRAVIARLSVSGRSVGIFWVGGGSGGRHLSRYVINELFAPTFSYWHPVFPQVLTSAAPFNDCAPIVAMEAIIDDKLSQRERREA